MVRAVERPPKKMSQFAPKRRRLPSGRICLTSLLYTRLEHSYIARASLPTLDPILMKPTVLAVLCLAVPVAACSKSGNVDINSGGLRTVQTQSRSEPIFYNGKHYALNYTYNEAMKAFDVKVAGTTTPMKADSQTDAVNIASSSLSYFACPDGQKGRLVGSPQFNAGTWALQARCG
jgi:hypothetical protein